MALVHRAVRKARGVETQIRGQARTPWALGRWADAARPATRTAPLAAGRMSALSARTAPGTASPAENSYLEINQSNYSSVYRKIYVYVYRGIALMLEESI